MAQFFIDDALAQLTGSGPCNGVAREATPPVVDPVFAAIEKHKAAWLAFQAATAAMVNFVDIPQHLDDAQSVASDVETEARNHMHEAVPQTIAGLLAYVSYWNTFCEKPPGCKFSQLDEVGWEAIPTIAEAITALLPPSKICPKQSTNAEPSTGAVTRLTGSTPPGAADASFTPVATDVVPAGYDAELVALGAKLDRLLVLATEAHADRYRLEAERDSNLPCIPDGLIVDPDHRLGEDVEYFTAYLPQEEDGRARRYYTAKAIEQIRKAPRTKFVFDRWLDEGNSYDRVMKRVPDEETQARADAVVAAFEAWEQACRQLSAAIGYEAAAARHDDLELQARAVFDRIEEITPLTLAGLAVQARTMVTYSRGNLLKEKVAHRLEQFAAAEAVRSELKIDDAGPDAALVALGAKLDGIEAVLAPIRERYHDPRLSDDDPIISAYEEIDERSNQVMMAIADTPTSTLRGFVVKARGLLPAYPDGLTKDDVRIGESTDIRLMWSIIAGLIDLGTTQVENGSASTELAA